MQHPTQTWLLTVVAGDINQSHDCRKTAQWSVKSQEHSCVTTVTSTLATGTDGQPQLIQRTMKALGMANLFPLPLFFLCIESLQATSDSSRSEFLIYVTYQ